MKEVLEFIRKKTITLKDFPGITTKMLKGWVEDYKKLDNPEESFMDYIEDHAWVIADSGYAKIKNYDLFYLDENNQKLFGTQDEVTHDKRKDYFRPLFNSIFKNQETGELNLKKLSEWVKETVIKYKKEAYQGLIDRSILLEEPEISEILLSLFVDSLDITAENYYYLTDESIPTLDEAEFLIDGFIDFTDPNIELFEKWNYIRVYGNITPDTVRKVLSRLSSYTNLKQRREIQKLISGKNRNLNLPYLENQLAPETREMFCNIWQELTGK